MASTPTEPLLSSRSQFVFPAIAAVFTVVILSAVADLVVTALATQSVGAQFRFQVIGVLFASAPQFAVLLALIAALGTVGGHRLAVRGAALAALAFSLVLIVLIPFYLLDFLQTRRLVSESNLKGFTLAGMKTGAFAAGFAVMLLWAGWRAFQASRGGDEGEKRMKGQGLVVGQE